MNAPILTKILGELNQKQPRLDYVRGMLETLLELEGSSVVEHSPVKRVVASSNPALPDDEAAILDAHARAKLASIKALSQDV